VSPCTIDVTQDVARVCLFVAALAVRLSISILSLSLSLSLSAPVTTPVPTGEVWDPLALLCLELLSSESCGAWELTSKMSQADVSRLLAVFSGPSGHKKLAAILAVLVGVRANFE